MNKERIDDVIVVEGIHDLQKLQSIYDVDILYTNGSAVSTEFIESVRVLSQTRSIIVFTDPDFPGQKIRQAIMQAIPTVKHAYIDKSKALGKGKVGVEHASVADIKEALQKVMTPAQNESVHVSWADLVQRDLIIGEEAKKKRDAIANKLHLGHVNAKQFWKHLNLFGIEATVLDKMIEEYDGEESSNENRDKENFR